MYKNNSSSGEIINNTGNIKNPNGVELSQHGFKGEIIEPGHAEYLRLSETITHKGAPRLILRPKTIDDIISALNYVRTNSLTFSIRSGGHGLPGFATNSDGIVIDLSAFNKVELIDSKRNIVRVGAGALWGDVAAKLQEHNLVISSGDTKSVGVGGLTLGGGFGWMVRKTGLTIDNLISAEVVTADGRFITANPEQNSDLFWAIRGGGGNFCVVTSFDFKAYALNKIVAGMVQYSTDNMNTILKRWRDYMRTVNENLNSTIRIMPPMFGNPPSVIILICYAGNDNTEARNTIDPLLHLDKVLHNNIKEMNYFEFLEEAMKPPETIKVIVKNSFAKEFSDKLIDAITSVSGKANSPAIQIRSINGKINRIDPDATAFPFRNNEILISAGTFLPKETSEVDKLIALKPWDTINAFCSGTYVNFLSEEEEMENIYPGKTYNSLSEIKKKYDPENIFKRNYNIKP